MTIANAPAPAVSSVIPPGRIEIVMADAIVRTEGTGDAATVRAVPQGVRP